MKIRQAMKIRDRIAFSGWEYRKSTVDKMRRRLLRTGQSDDTDIEFHRLIGGFQKSEPFEFARLQFDCGMSLIGRGLIRCQP